MNTPENIHRRFSLLFTLPATPLNVALLMAVTAPIPILTVAGRADLTSITASLAGFELLLFTSIYIERYLLKINSLATFRRLAFTSFASNILWLMIVAIGLLVYPSQPLSLLVLGALYALTFRILIFRSVFFGRLRTALLTSLLQPALLILSFTPYLPLLGEAGVKPSVYIGGSVLVASALIYLQLVNTSGGNRIQTSALTMFQAFLKAWSSEQPEPLEEIIDKSGSETSIRTSLLAFDTGGASRPVLVVPEAHPGPFYPIGSSNLPFQIHQHLSKRGLNPLVLHGVSGHELNLISKKEVERFLSSLGDLVDSGGGSTCTKLLTVSFGRASAHGVAFGEYALAILTLSPHGMEDLPLTVKQSINEAASSLGFRQILLVDAHNSQGSFPGYEECRDLVETGEELLKRLKVEQQYPFRVGYSHSSELGSRFGRDMGPAGLGVFALEVGGDRYLMVAADANNARKGLREEIVGHFKASDGPVVELCTSDTHITASKVMTVNGYLALGDETPVDYLIGVVEELSGRALERLSEARFDVKYVDVDVRVIGEGMLKDISAAMDRVLLTVRRGGLSLVATSLAVLFFTLTF